MTETPRDQAQPPAENRLRSLALGFTVRALAAAEERLAGKPEREDGFPLDEVRHRRTLRAMRDALEGPAPLPPGANAGLGRLSEDFDYFHLSEADAAYSELLEGATTAYSKAAAQESEPRS